MHCVPIGAASKPVVRSRTCNQLAPTHPVSDHEARGLREVVGRVFQKLAVKQTLCDGVQGDLLHQVGHGMGPEKLNECDLCRISSQTLYD